MSRPGQRGIVLIMSLVLLIVISLVAALAVKRSISAEQVSKALRTNAMAFQAAETALRYCEDQVLTATGTPGGSIALTTHPAPTDGSAPTLWRDRANWATDGMVVQIDDALVNSSDAAARTLPALPRCMVERLWLPGDVARRAAFLITAVGFSPDYRKTEAGTPNAGGEVWLQSTVTPLPQIE